MDILLVQLEAPMMSFGAPMIDKHGVIQPFPALSMVAGLFANALGYHHRDWDKIQTLQDGLDFACRQDRQGTKLREYQTVNLGASYMNDELAWTTDGSIEKRAGGNASSGTHIRLRDYWADAAYTLAVATRESGIELSIDMLAQALKYPARPLFIGRKNCLPAATMYKDVVDSPDLVQALIEAPLVDNADEGPYTAWYSSATPGNHSEGISSWMISDSRDWKNQIHVGQRWINQIDIELNIKEGANG